LIDSKVGSRGILIDDDLVSPLGDVSQDMPGIHYLVGDHLKSVQKEIRRIVASDFDMIEDINKYLMMMKGKLFRPTLLLLANQVGGKPSNDAVTLASVVELVHLATLVHDDAVDHSVLRRGLPTVNCLWTHQISIIMGDYLYSRSITELTHLGKIEVLKVLAEAANDMSVGEMRQLMSYDALGFTEEDYYRLIEAKTASLMSAACEIGALEGVSEYCKPLAFFGYNLGMAFQIIDDLLDYTGSEAVIGKPSGQDLRERKVTLPLVRILNEVSDVEMSEIRKFFTLTNPSEKDIECVIGIVSDRGGFSYARERAELYAERAYDALNDLQDDIAIEALRSTVQYTIGRYH
jgi:octaprenyl-diphosphate synthase